MYKFSDGLKNLSGAATREILKLTQRPEVISFAGGMPASECLPIDEIADITNGLFDTYGEKLLQYGRTEGFDELNTELKNYLGTLGMFPKGDEIRVVSGGQQGIDLMCKAFLNKGDCVLCEDPTYLVFLQIARTYGANIVGVKSNDDGLVLFDLEDKLKKYSPKLLYTVPTFSNPTGRTYSAENRKHTVELCEKYGTVIIEDDPYGMLRFEGESVPAMKTFDKSGTVVYITSFSKTIAPSLRVAVCYGNCDIIRKITIGKQGTDVHNPALTQFIVAEYLKRGLFRPHLKQSIEVYKTRCDAFLSALDAYMPSGVDYTRPNGGLFIWATLPGYVDAKEMLGEAIEKNVAYINGSEFYADGGGKNTLRLNFSGSNEERINKGVKILSEIIEKKIKEHC